MSYHIQATDGDIGHVQGLLVDEETWAIRYIIVDTSNWWLGHQVLIAPQWIRDVSWSDATVSVDLTHQAVKDAPPYDSAARWIVSRKWASTNIMGVPAIGWARQKAKNPAISSLSRQSGRFGQDTRRNREQRNA